MDKRGTTHIGSKPSRSFTVPWDGIMINGHVNIVSWVNVKLGSLSTKIITDGRHWKCILSKAKTTSKCGLTRPRISAFSGHCETSRRLNDSSSWQCDVPAAPVWHVSPWVLGEGFHNVYDLRNAAGKQSLEGRRASYSYSFVIVIMIIYCILSYIFLINIAADQQGP